MPAAGTTQEFESRSPRTRQKQPKRTRTSVSPCNTPLASSLLALVSMTTSRERDSIELLPCVQLDTMLRRVLMHKARRIWHPIYARNLELSVCSRARLRGNGCACACTPGWISTRHLSWRLQTGVHACAGAATATLKQSG